MITKMNSRLSGLKQLVSTSSKSQRFYCNRNHQPRQVPYQYVDPIKASPTSEPGTRWTRTAYRDLFNRKQLLGEEPYIPRSRYDNWNRNAELFALSHRLGAPEVAPENLDVAFQFVDPPTNHIQRGRELTSRFVENYLKRSLPAYPQEGIESIREYLLSSYVLPHIGRHLLLHDLIENGTSKPISDDEVSESLLALIAILHEEQAAVKFVQYFLLPQLIGIDLQSLFHVSQPYKVLEAVAKSKNQSIEPRLQNRAGEDSLMQIYQVGIYNNLKQQMGTGAGENLVVAIDLAARDALNKIWNFELDTFNFDFHMKLSDEILPDHESLNDICQKFADFDLTVEEQPIYSSSRDYTDEERNAAESHYDDPVFSDLQQVYENWKDGDGKTMSSVYRRHQRHMYSRGSIARRSIRSMIRKTPHNI